VGSDFLLFVLIGFAAQIIDGAIGMAYGLISATVLLSLGTSPASASVHAAEVFTTAASTASHWRFTVPWGLAGPLRCHTGAVETAVNPRSEAWFREHKEPRSSCPFHPSYRFTKLPSPIFSSSFAHHVCGRF